MKSLIAAIALISSLTAISAETIASGTVKAWTENNDTVVKFQGPAAELTFNKLDRSLQQEVRLGSLFKTVREGADVVCERQAAIITNYSCVLKITESGTVIK